METEQQTTIATAQLEPTSRLEPRAATTITAQLLPDQRDVLRQALADAVYYRDPPVYCPACDTPDRLCRQCAAGLSQALSYITLSRELGVSPDDLAEAATR